MVSFGVCFFFSELKVHYKYYKLTFAARTKRFDGDPLTSVCAIKENKKKRDGHAKASNSGEESSSPETGGSDRAVS